MTQANGQKKPTYQVGDKVKCIDDSMCSITINFGSIYTVADIRPDTGDWFVLLEERVGSWMRADRFELATAISERVSKDIVIDSAIAINDCTCPTCKNDRCSSTEKTCWRCGGNL